MVFGLSVWVVLSTVAVNSRFLFNAELRTTHSSKTAFIVILLTGQLLIAGNVI